MKIPITVVLVGLPLLLAATGGCSSTRIIDQEGVVSTRLADQGVYAITGPDSVVYHPLNLPDRYQEEGLAVIFTATERPSARVKGMTGTPVELQEILPVHLEGAFTVHQADTLGLDFGLIDAEGRRFQPLTPLAQDYLLDSLQVTAHLRVRPDTLADSTLWGRPVEVDGLAYADTTLRGTVARVVYHTFEGGFYGLVDLDGLQWRPTAALPDAFLEDGLQVRALLRPAELELSAQMWGQPAEVVRLQPLD